MKQDTVRFDRLIGTDAINARTRSDDGLEELAASIKSKGLIQPIAVRSRGADDKLEIIDGRRRWQALARLVKAKAMKPADLVPVIIRDEADNAEALETSLMANMVRLPMHPVDQHEVFAKLQDSGSTVPEIASRFGIAEKTVRGHLALGKLAPEIRSAWRSGKIDGEVARSFTLTADPKRQAKLFSELAGSGHVSGWQVRKALTGEKQRTDTETALFVGAEAYTAAGGTITQSLFDDHGFIDDGELLDRLAREKVAARCRELEADGWEWAKFADDVSNRWSLEKAKATPQHTEVEAARIAEIRAILATDDADDYEAGDTLSTEIDRIDSAAIERGFTAKQRKKLGVIVDIGPDGQFEYTWGLKVPTSKRQIDVEDAIDEAGSTDEPEKVALSAALVQTLTEMQTTAAQKALEQSGLLALRALLAHLRATRGHGSSPLKITLSGMNRAPHEEDAGEFDELLSISPNSLAVLASDLTPMIAAALDLRAYSASAVRPDDVALVNALNGEAYLEAMRELFDPVDYFARVPKDMATEAIAEMIAAGAATANDMAPENAKKAVIAELAATAAKRCGWLPELLRHPAYRIATKTEAAPAKSKKKVRA